MVKRGPYKRLTPKHLEFIRHYTSGASAHQAALAAGFSPGYASHAAALLKNPKIQAELKTMGDKVREQTLYDATAATAELNEAIEFSRSTKNATAAVRAIELKMRLNALLVERIDSRNVAGFRIQIAGIDDDASQPGAAPLKLASIDDAPQPGVKPITLADIFD